ncbi:hypothetical protein MOE50_16365 [Bacillus inaquosorum]|uniref:hypothetical protein n=1 Tax=Bacillus inaquosorum TaxID=483913 RepID=UPI00227F931C|nr:hypothetical protein [Bacillus inaquosorum]MCY9010547.1 hypothetical protein [Bacillus inaquosorum]MCY9036688.1 hypothetical protein [Bacillus inaquosorum]MCY9045030.1 hypothetical protein [Bacillus inaquosorum]
MFYYNTLKSTLRMKWPGIITALLLQLISIYFFFCKENGSSDGFVLENIFSYWHLVSILCPAAVVFSVLISSDYFSIYTVIRVNNAPYLTLIYLFKTLLFSAVYGIIIMGELYTLCVFTNTGILYLTPISFITHVFAFIFICYVVSFTLLYLNQIIVVFLFILLFLIDYLVCNGMFFLNGFVLEFSDLAELLLIRLGIMLLLFGISIESIKRRNYLQQVEEKGAN